MMSSLMATLGLDVSPFKRGTMEAQADAKHAGQSIGESLGGFIGEKIGSIASLAAFEELARAAVEYGAKIENLSKRTGIGSEALQEFDYALKQNGSSIDEGSQFFEKFAIARQKALKGNEDMIGSMSRLGVSMEMLRSGARNESLILNVAEAFKSGDQEALIADMRAVGGRGAGAMAAAFRDGLPEMMEEARKLGQVMDSETTEKLEDIERTGKRTWGSLRAEIGATTVGVWEFGSAWVQGVQTAMAGAAGLFKGGAKGAKEAMTEFTEGSAAMANKEEERNRKAKEHGGPLDLEGVQNEKGLSRLKDEAAKKIRENQLSEMTGEEKLLFLQKERAELLASMAREKPVEPETGAPAAMTKKEQGEAAVRVAELDKEINRAASESHKEKDQLAKKQEANAMAEMTSQEKLLFLEQKRAEVNERISNAKSNKDRLASQLELADIDKEIWQAGKAETGQSRGPRSKPELNALQQMGAFAATQDNPLLNVTQKQALNIEKIQKSIDLIANLPAGGTQY